MQSAGNSKKGKSRDPMASLRKFIMIMAEKKRLNPQNAIAVFDAILQHSGGKGISDEELAAMFGFSQSEVRKILRILYDNGLAKYRRGRHPETGATRYFWYIDLSAVNVVLVSRKREVVRRLKEKLKYEEENEFYYCPNHPLKKYTFDEAFSLNFQCPKCGHVLEQVDNSARIEILREIIRRLEEEIKEDEARIRAS